MARINETMKQRDLDSFKTRKNYEEREQRKESKYRKTVEDYLVVEEEEDIETEFDSLEE